MAPSKRQVHQARPRPQTKTEAEAKATRVMSTAAARALLAPFDTRGAEDSSSNDNSKRDSAEDEEEENRAFLADLIASGAAPRAEVDRLLAASLTAGAEDWYMLLDWARSICRQGGGGSVAGGLGAGLELLYCVEKALLEGEEGREGRGQVPLVNEALLCPRGQGERAVKAAEEKKGRKRKREEKQIEKGKSPYFTTTSQAPATHLRQDEEEDGGQACKEVPEPDDAMPRQRKKRKHQPAPTKETLSAGTRVSDRGQLSEPDAVSRELQGDSPTRRDEEVLWQRDVASELRTCTDFGPHSHLKKGDLRLFGEVASHGQADKGEEEEGKSAATRTATATSKTTKASRKPAAKSPYFASEAETPSPDSKPRRRRPPRGTVSALPIPPLSAPRFGLVQETLAHDPFRLLVAVTFLIRTSGRASLPVCEAVLVRWPTPAALAAADPREMQDMTRHLGLSAVRTAAVQRYARLWLERPPHRGARFAVKNYPNPGDGREVRAGEEFGAEDDDGEEEEEDVDNDDEDQDLKRARRRRIKESAWEIGHMTQGAYAIDSWRIFCRDALLGRAASWNGEGAAPRGPASAFQPEWMRVLPRDKELRACLRWMWMREGWEWDPLTGEREVLREELRAAVDEGRVGYDDAGRLVILEEGG